MSAAWALPTPDAWEIGAVSAKWSEGNDLFPPLSCTGSANSGPGSGHLVALPIARYQ